MTKAQLKQLIKEVLTEETALSKLPVGVNHLFLDDINSMEQVVKFIRTNNVKSAYLILGSDAIKLGKTVDNPKAWYICDKSLTGAHKALLATSKDIE